MPDSQLDPQQEALLENSAVLAWRQMTLAQQLCGSNGYGNDDATVRAIALIIATNYAAEVARVTAS